MTDRNSYRPRSRDSNREESRGYHPYDSVRSGSTHGGSRDHRRAPSSRVMSVAEALKTDRLMTIEQFSATGRFGDDTIRDAYAQYIKDHQQAHLHSVFAKHKKKQWFQRLLSGDGNAQDGCETRMQTFAAIPWTDASLVHHNLPDMKKEETSGSGCASYIVSVDTELPVQLARLMPPHARHTISMSNIPPYLDHESILKHVTSCCPSESIATLSLTAPNADKNFYQLAWMQLRDTSNSEAVTQLLTKLEALGSIDGAKVYFAAGMSDYRRIRVSDVATESDAKDLSLALQLISALERREFGEKDLGGADQTLPVTSELLDRAIMYLRIVHFFCFYCATGFTCAQELLNRCGDVHLRRFATDATEHERLCERLVATVEFITLLRRPTDPQLSLETRVDSLLTETSVAKVDEGKYRCTSCSKAFKGPEFVLKHLRLKHEELIHEAESDVKGLVVLQDTAPLWLFPATMFPRLLTLKRQRSRSASESSKTSATSRRLQDYIDLDAASSSTLSTTEISYDF